jgi:SHS2 domain-containing protein
MFETFEHTADIGLRVRAASFAELLAEAGRGLFSLIVANLDQVRLVQELAVRLPAAGPPDLVLFDWLHELLFLYDTRRLVLAEFSVQCDAEQLTARVRGELLDEHRHVLDHEVKAITYHGLRAEQQGGQWLGEVILDI